MVVEMKMHIVTLRVEESVEGGEDLGGSSGSTSPSRIPWRGTDVVSLSSAIEGQK